MNGPSVWSGLDVVDLEGNLIRPDKKLNQKSCPKTFKQEQKELIKSWSIVINDRTIVLPSSASFIARERKLTSSYIYITFELFCPNTNVFGRLDESRHSMQWHLPLDSSFIFVRKIGMF